MNKSYPKGCYRDTRDVKLCSCSLLISGQMANSADKTRVMSSETTQSERLPLNNTLPCQSAGDTTGFG